MNSNIAVPVSSPCLNGVLNAECTAGKENIIVHFESVGKWGWCEDCHLCQECHGSSALEEAGDCEDVWQQRHRCHISTIYNDGGGGVVGLSDDYVLLCTVSQFRTKPPVTTLPLLEKTAKTLCLQSQLQTIHTKTKTITSEYSDHDVADCFSC